MGGGRTRVENGLRDSDVRTDSFSQECFRNQQRKRQREGFIAAVFLILLTLIVLCFDSSGVNVKASFMKHNICIFFSRDLHTADGVKGGKTRNITPISTVNTPMIAFDCEHSL